LKFVLPICRAREPVEIAKGGGGKEGGQEKRSEGAIPLERGRVARGEDGGKKGGGELLRGEWLIVIPGKGYLEGDATSWGGNTGGKSQRKARVATGKDKPRSIGDLPNSGQVELVHKRR